MNGGQIGVVCLYKAQSFLIRRLIGDSSSASDCVLVSTVDAFQGGERDIIILNTVRSHGIGHAAYANRINVAVTRARRHLFVVGNCANIATARVWSHVITEAKRAGR